MSDIAKKYINALIKSVKKDELTQISSSLQKLVPFFKDMKFRSILYANDISKEKKVELLLSLMGVKKNKKIRNFISLLVAYDRVDIIPNLAKELKFEVAKLTNSHEGLIITNKKLSAKSVEEISKKIGKKFNTQVKLLPKVEDYDGIKVEVETLGVEIAFSTSRLKEMLAQEIFRSI